MTRFISTQSIMLELPLEIPHLPERGGDVPAAVSGTTVGGGFALVSAVARQGIAAFLASPLGTGPNSVQARYALVREGIAVMVSEVVGDNGLRIVLLEESGMRTTVTSPGVEMEPSRIELERIELAEGDWVYVSTDDLVYESSASVIGPWVQSLPPKVHLVLAGGGMISEIKPHLLRSVMSRANLFTLNRREAKVAVKALGDGPTEDVLRRYLNNRATLILRDGAQGCTVQPAAGTVPIGIGAFPTEPRDTSGVGDAHTGVLIAGMILGLPLPQAARRANAAASIALSRKGTAVCPTAAEIDDFLARYGRQSQQ